MSRLRTLPLLAAAAFAASPIRGVAAQLNVWDDRQRFISDVQGKVEANNLDALPDGTVEIPFGAGGVVTLAGASVTRGQIVSAVPFVVTIANPRVIGFGADFSADAADELVLSFFSGATRVGSISRPLLAGAPPRFVGGIITGGRSPLTRVEVGTLRGARLTVDNTIVALPEPSTWALFGAGALAAAGIARRRHSARA